jgi:hypothetical protein
MRNTHTFLALSAGSALCLTAIAQDSVSKFHALPGDAVDARNPAEQVNNFIVDQAALHSSWGTAFGVAPIIKVSIANEAQGSPPFMFFTEQESAQAISRLLKSNAAFPHTSYSLWNGQGFGVNNNTAANDPGTPVSTVGFSGFQFGVGFSEFSTGLTNPGGVNAALSDIIGGVVNFTPAVPSRLYVSRVAAATNGTSDSCNLGAFGYGSVDEDGAVAFRADNFSAVDCSGNLALTGQNYFRVRMLARNAGTVNAITNAGGLDAGATDWPAPMNQTTTLDCPNAIPTSVNGRSIIIGSNFTTQYVFEQFANTLTTDAIGAHLAAGITDHRGNAAYTPFNFTGIFGAASTSGTSAFVGKGSGALTDHIDVFGLDSTGQFVAPFGLALPAVITDPDQPAWNSGIVAGTQQFDHYHGSVAFNGGSGQVSLGKDQAGNMLTAATVYYGGVSNTDKNNYIAVARTTPAGATTWSVAGWTREDSSVPVSDGKIIYMNGTTPIGRMTGALFGPAIAAPMIDSVGNVWFLAGITLNGPPVVNAVGLLRAVYQPATFSYKLELVLREGDVFKGQNSTTNYKINFLSLAGSTSISPGTAWSGNIAASAFENQNPASLNVQSSDTLGGLVLSAGIIYDVNGDGQFIRSTGANGTPGSPDEDYQVLLYVASTKDCNNNNVPDDADIANGTSHDTNLDGIPDECQNLGPGVPFCIPGVGGVMACPCGNPQVPANSVKGCNNSAATGGAALTATGTASLAADSLAFASAGEKPTASSILLQGQNPPSAAGVKFGQGVRCITQVLKRLYVHNAVAGTVTFPQGGDPNVHTQSMIKGDTIPAGSTRLYLVYYRDPTVLGACTPLVDTFNASQGLSVLWTP